MSKSKSIRSKIIIMLVVPLVALAALWVFTVGQAIDSALDLRTATVTGEQVGWPGDQLIRALQAERSRTQEYIARGRRNAYHMRTQRVATDRAIATFRKLAGGYNAAGVGSDATRARIRETLTSLAELSRIRATVDTGTATRQTARSDYDQAIAVVSRVLHAVAHFSDPDVDRQMHVLYRIARASELFSQEDALLSGAIVAGGLTREEQAELVRVVNVLRYELSAASVELAAPLVATYVGMLESPASAAVRQVEDRLVEAGSVGAVAVGLDVWRSAFDAADRQLHDFLMAGFDTTLSAARADGTAALTRIYLAGGTGLLVIALSVFMSWRSGRLVVLRLTALRTAATELAHRRLPELVRRLRAGEQVGEPCDELDLPPGSDEIAQVGAAFDEVHRRAVESAVAEAAVRRGMNQVFVNISRRNQTLLHRQAVLLEQLHNTASDPEQLRRITLADRLAVRMRRHAEHLVILAGDVSGGGRRSRVPLPEIVGGAAAEIEAADRVDVQAVAEVELPGQVAPDVVHVLAELLENATAYSPPDTRVQITSQRVPHGVYLEIVDRGLGMSAQALEEANALLSEPPDFDPADSARLGLFIVAQLAARRRLRVSLRQSAYGGVTAVVLIPPELFEQPGGAATRTPNVDPHWPVPEEEPKVEVVTGTVVNGDGEPAGPNALPHRIPNQSGIVIRPLG